MPALLRGITRNGSELSALQPPCTVQNGCCMRHPRACGSLTRIPHATAWSDAGRDGALHQMMRPGRGNRTDFVAHDLFGDAGLHRSVKYVGANTTLPTLGFPSQVRAEVNEWILQKHRECPLCNTLPLRHAGNYSFRMLDYVGPMDIVCSPEKTSCTSGSVMLRPRPTPCDHTSAAAYWFALDGTQAHFHHFMMEWLPQLAYLLAVQELEMLSGNISLVVDSLIANSTTLRQALLTLELPVEAVQALRPGGLMLHTKGHTISASSRIKLSSLQSLLREGLKCTAFLS
ncbi:hypothetical protein AB1Y20_003698 [Prymnesium parvum]|uniref:Uncharacterized protein n=1 Tax=Prymnesium parvum TaxID=97485 RepID=A0AB34J5H6_PRYPA